MNKQLISVVGLGYVGLPLAVLAAQKGYEATGIDLAAKKVQKINQGISPIEDDKLTASLKSRPLKAYTDFQSIAEAQIIIICVPTPVHDDYRPNLAPLEAAVKEIGHRLKAGQLIILESTVNPGVSEKVVLPILEKSSGLKGGRDFHLSHCPERINPGDTKWEVNNIPRVVGSLDRVGLQKTLQFYQSIIEAPVKPMASLREAEAVKIVENTFRDINIAFVNELAMSFDKLGIDVVNVIKGAATKPFAFMPHYPGVGVGGHCIPVDPYYLIDYAKKSGFQHDFLILARRINHSMPEFAVEALAEAIKANKRTLKGAKVAVLGLAYKPNVDDDRESPSYEIIKLLGDRGARIISYDPHLPEKSTAKSLQVAISQADAVIVATAHREFLQLGPTTLSGVVAVVDGRNCLDANKFVGSKIVYRGIGRSVA